MPAAPTNDALLRYRSQFPILETTTYLISNSLGAMPRGVAGSLQSYAEIWAARGVRAWEDKWWMLALEVGDQIGALMNAPAGSINIHQNVTVCQAVAASCFDFSGKRNKVVYDDLNFPGVMYFWEAQRRRGARVILDTFQSLGTVPVDVTALGADFATGGVLKWLCGGSGVAYLYVRPDLAPKLEPTLTGWFAHQEPFAFETGAIRYTDGPYRFSTGTSNVPALYAAQPGLKIIQEVGVENIRRKSERQTARLIELAEAHGWRVNTPRDPAKRGGTVSIDMPNAQEVCAELLKRDILVDYRPRAGVRMSPHFYNQDEELDTAIAAVEEILSTMKVPAR